jgi:hypothetical protein
MITACLLSKPSLWYQQDLHGPVQVVSVRVKKLGGSSFTISHTHTHTLFLPAGAAVLHGCSLDVEAQNAAYLALSHVLQVQPPSQLQPLLQAMGLSQGLPVALWAQRLALAAFKGPLTNALAGGGSRMGAQEVDSSAPGAKGLVLGRLSMGASTEAVAQVAASVARRVLPHLQARQDMQD